MSKIMKRTAEVLKLENEYQMEKLRISGDTQGYTPAELPDYQNQTRRRHDMNYYEEERAKIEAEYLNTKSIIITDYANKTYLVNEKLTRLSHNVKAAGSRFANNCIVIQSWFEREHTMLKEELLKAEAKADSGMAVMKLRIDYSISVEGITKERNSKLDNIADDLADAKNVYNTEYQACLKLLRDLKLQRDSQLHRAQELKHEKIVAIEPMREEVVS